MRHKRGMIADKSDHFTLAKVVKKRPLCDFLASYVLVMALIGFLVGNKP